jgi:predicted alpha/beta-fold hydrolase
MRVAGHLWTAWAHISRLTSRVELPTHSPWEAAVDDPDLGSVRLTGELIPAGRPEALIVVHGLGGSSESGYVRAAAAAAAKRDLTTLRLNLRGADRSGEDFYHAGLTVDLRAAVESAALETYDRLLILGYSLGGHLTLRYVIDGADPRVAAVATICAPLDLSACCDLIDRPSRWIYRRYLLRKLMEIYREVAARREVPLAVAEAAAIRLQRQFDDRIIAKRHGFDGVEDYYSTVSVGPTLGAVDRPALLVQTEDDPMIPASTLRPYLAAASSTVEQRWVRGGHVGFPAGLDLGVAGAKGIENQIVSWLLAAPHECAPAVC